MLEEELQELQTLLKGLKRFKANCENKNFNCYYDHLEFNLNDAQGELEYKIAEIKEEMKEQANDTSDT